MQRRGACQLLINYVLQLIRPLLESKLKRLSSLSDVFSGSDSGRRTSTGNQSKRPTAPGRKSNAIPRVRPVLVANDDSEVEDSEDDPLA